MSLLKSSLLVLVAASTVFVAETSAEAQNRTGHRTHQGMSGGGGTQMQSSIQAAQNQARSIAARQHQIWLANRLKKNAAEKAAKANGTDTKATANTKSTTKSTEPAKSSSADESTTKATPTSTTK